MKALVISGGGSKGAFGGGVVQYLIEKEKRDYDLYIGTSTGSLLISHLALKKIEKIKRVFTNVNQKSIFSNCPFHISKNKWGEDQISVSHLKVLYNFLRGHKTFGDSSNLRKLIENTITEAEFETLQKSHKDILVTVSNLSLQTIEYKSINDVSYQDFCDWIWISCNYTPFMSLVKKEGCEYADGGFGSIVPIKEAIDRGATEVDVIILETEITQYNRLASKNVFSLISNLHDFMINRIEKQNITIGKFAASHQNAIINLYYTPTLLTTNSLIFNKEKMSTWWESGYQYAATKNKQLNAIKSSD